MQALLETEERLKQALDQVTKARRLLEDYLITVRLADKLWRAGLAPYKDPVVLTKSELVKIYQERLETCGRALGKGLRELANSLIHGQLSSVNGKDSMLKLAPNEQELYSIALTNSKKETIYVSNYLPLEAAVDYLLKAHGTSMRSEEVNQRLAALSRSTPVKLTESTYLVIKGIIPRD